jgi:hypothetical protein
MRLQLTLLTSALLFFLGNTAGSLDMRTRIPRTTELPTPINWIYYREGVSSNIVFRNYDEAIGAIEEWNSSYSKRCVEYEEALETWRGECQRIKEEAEDKAVFEEYTTEEYVLVPIYYEALGVWVFGWQKRKTNDIVKIIPDYELPSKPTFDCNGYREAKTGFCYLIGDGLTYDEWRYLRLILFKYRAIERGLGMYNYEDDINSLHEKGYIIVSPHKKSWKDSFSEKKKKYDLSLTEKGKTCFEGLTERCWNYRKGLIENARDTRSITVTEYEDLANSNDEIREVFLDQLSKPEDWSPHGPDKYEELFAKFAVGTETAFEKFPYVRVLNAIELPEEPITK